MKNIEVKTNNISDGMIEYNILANIDAFEVSICFLYLENINVIHPGVIFIRNIMTMLGGYIYTNSNYIFLNRSISPLAFEESDYITSLKKQFPEFTTFSETILGYIDKYCKLHKPTVIYDFERVKANP